MCCRILLPHYWLINSLLFNTKWTIFYIYICSFCIKLNHIGKKWSTLDVFYCSKRQKDNTQFKHLRQSYPGYWDGPMDNRLNCCKFSFTYKQCGSLDTGCIHLHMCTLVHSQLFVWDSCYWIFSFICMFCRLFFAILYFFFWPLCCLSFFDVRLIITPLVSSNRSYHPPRPQRVSFVFISCLTSSLSYFQRGCNPQ